MKSMVRNYATHIVLVQSVVLAFSLPIITIDSTAESADIPYLKEREKKVWQFFQLEEGDALHDKERKRHKFF